MTSCNIWPPPRRPKPIIVLVPGSVLSTEHTLLLKSLKAGVIARALSVFRVDEVIIYKDPDTSSRDQRILFKILRYLETPPHLRKKLIPIENDLKWVGMLPPLRTPTHDVPETPIRGQVLEGIVISKCKVYLGRKLHVWRIVGSCKELEVGSRVLIRVINPDLKIAEIIPETEPIYRGYRIEIKDSIDETLVDLKSRDMFILATSRKGECINDENIIKKITKGYKESRGLALVFGGPRLGLLDFVKRSELFDLVINLIPLQGTKTVRTEEALWVTLSIINIITCT